MEERPRRPRWRPLAVAAAGNGVGFAAIQQSVAGLLWQEPWHWDAFALTAGIFGLLVGPAWMLGARLGARAGAPARVDRVRRAELVRAALDAGRIPGGADPGAWRRALAEERRETSAAVGLVFFYAVLVAAMVGAAAVVANDGSPAVWAVAVVALGYGGAAHVAGSRRRRALRRLERQASAV